MPTPVGQSHAVLSRQTRPSAESRLDRRQSVWRIQRTDENSNGGKQLSVSVSTVNQNVSVWCCLANTLSTTLSKRRQCSVATTRRRCNTTCSRRWQLRGWVQLELDKKWQMVRRYLRMRTTKNSVLVEPRWVERTKHAEWSHRVTGIEYVINNALEVKPDQQIIEKKTILHWKNYKLMQSSFCKLLSRRETVLLQ